MKEQKKGISLIVLVITIIVMIILASAVIISLSNSNIITKAKEAVNKTNEKALEQQATLYEAELKLEFRDLGFSNMILSKDAKEVYKNAIKEGKTEEEARIIAKDTFIGTQYDWYINTTTGKISMFFDKLGGGIVDYTPMYKEVKRVIEKLESSEDVETAKQDLDIDKSVVPKDLVEDIKKYQQLIIDYYNGSVDDDTFDSTYEGLTLLNGYIAKDPNNKYFYDIAIVRLPYYIYEDFNKTKITTMVGKGFDNRDYGIVDENIVSIKDITVLILDDNYTVLEARAIPPINANAKIILPDTLKVIKKGAFAQCIINKIEIPSSVEQIEEGAFNYAIGQRIKEIVIKKEEGSISGYPWGLDTTKTTITWEP